VNKILMYVDDDRVCVLCGSGDEAEELIVECGMDLADWPEDLGAYRKESGLWAWEGNIDEDDVFDGAFRKLDDAEWVNLKTQGKAWL
jgi:hypothetical protein